MAPVTLGLWREIIYLIAKNFGHRLVGHEAFPGWCGFGWS
jgi:hypothetical protein